MRIAGASFAHAQSVGVRAEFEVASIKANNTDERMDYGVRGDRLLGRNMPAIGWIEIAYKVREYQIIGPAWISQEKFDIEAKASNPGGDLRLMLQSLLASRFNLTTHRENKKSLVYSLVVGRGGIKMKLSKDQTPWSGDFPNGAPDGRPTSGASPTALAPGRIAGKAIPMSMFVTLLADQVGRPIVNRTGLTGRYDIDFRFAPSDTDTSPQSDATVPSVFTAIQEQLGMRLQPAKAPVEVLVIDHIERPSAN
jgi:uncharacterized protein (TIGR03435 family)